MSTCECTENSREVHLKGMTFMEAWFRVGGVKLLLCP